MFIIDQFESDPGPYRKLLEQWYKQACDFKEKYLKIIVHSLKDDPNISDEEWLKKHNPELVSKYDKPEEELIFIGGKYCGKFVTRFEDGKMTIGYTFYENK